MKNDRQIYVKVNEQILVIFEVFPFAFHAKEQNKVLQIIVVDIIGIKNSFDEFSLESNLNQV